MRFSKRICLFIYIIISFKTLNFVWKAIKNGEYEVKPDCDESFICCFWISKPGLLRSEVKPSKHSREIPFFRKSSVSYFFQVFCLHTATMLMYQMGLCRARLAEQVSFNIRAITLRGGHFYTATHLITELIKYAIAVPQSARARQLHWLLRAGTRLFNLTTRKLGHESYYIQAMKNFIV